MLGVSSSEEVVEGLVEEGQAVVFWGSGCRTWPSFVEPCL